MLKALLLALSLVPSQASADAPSGDIAISIARPMFAMAFPWKKLASATPQILAQLHEASHPILPTLRIADDSVVSVILKNCSSHDVRVWKESNSWGEPNVGFIFTLNTGQKILIKKKHHGWTQNVPIFYILHPQEEVVFNERPFTKGWDWTSDDLLTIDQMSSKSANVNSTDAPTGSIAPIYSIQDGGEKLCQQNQIWTGSIQGDGVKFLLKAPNVGTF